MTDHDGQSIATKGCWITVKEQGSDDEEVYQLAHVTNAVQNQLSKGDPMGKALFGAKPGDEVTVHAPSGPIKFKVLDVQSDEDR